MNQRIAAMIAPSVLMLILVMAGTGIISSSAFAEEPMLDVNSPDVIKQALEQQLGKRVKVRLESGQDVEGKVAKVGGHAVQLTDLTGMEFFEATIKLEKVAAVIVRVRTK